VIGTKLGPYEVLARLGEGGMGEVYRARDTKLNRDVAIKVLLPSVANDPDRLARFGREAHVLAALNHPNIAHIYGLEDPVDSAQGRRAGFLVMELVEGPTLADLIQASGSGLQVSQALAIARQIAEALEAAHEQGVIHRDLKPANIKVREDGTVKVLDFGLATWADGAGEAGGDLANSPTITSPVQMTRAGMILGTAAYMSPEQAAGKPADKRSDLWAFGVVLYEMLTARRLFEGTNVPYVLAAVLKDTPDWNALPANTPPQIRKLLRNCLEKNRKHRLDSATAARLEIDDALARPGAETSSQALSAPRLPVSAWSRGASLLAGVLLGAVLASAAVMMALAARTPSDVPRTPALTLAYRPLSFEPGGNSDGVWSPDGKGVAFCRSATR
jgi:serine/threonine-protein kinase